VNAVEFQTDIKNGMIEIPAEYRNDVKGTVRVIVLGSEPKQQADGIVLAAGNRKALVPALKKTYEREIPCAIVDSGVETDKYRSCLATDSNKGGGLLLPTFGGVAARPWDSVTPGKDFL
jgi:ABC-type sugar transport system substrate-binding protein